MRYYRENPDTPISHDWGHTTSRTLVDCDTCEGEGKVMVAKGFIKSIYETCDECDGTGMVPSKEDECTSMT